MLGARSIKKKERSFSVGQPTLYGGPVAGVIFQTD